MEIAIRTLLEKVPMSGIEKVKCQSGDLAAESTGCEELPGILSLRRFIGWFLLTSLGVSNDPLSLSPCAKYQVLY